MATSSLAMLFLFSFISILASTPPTSSSLPLSSVASTQLKFWSENVITPMPKSLLSKLSPLSEKESQHFAHLASKKSLKNEPNFCSLAHLACSSKVKVPNIISKDYTYLPGLMSQELQQVDPNLFFRLSTLTRGNQVHLPDLHNQFPPRAFLPNGILSTISITSNDIQMTFPNAFSSPTTKDAIQSTLAHCNAPALKGEIKGCLKTLEEMIAFSQNALGQKRVRVFSTQGVQGSNSVLLMGDIKQFRAKNFVSCHEVFLPFATYLCHLLSSTNLYAMDMIDPGTKAPVNTVWAACHMDTSEWQANHPAFKVLNSRPGEVEACHWLTQLDLTWLAEETV